MEATLGCCLAYANIVGLEHGLRIRLPVCCMEAEAPCAHLFFCCCNLCCAAARVGGCQSVRVFGYCVVVARLQMYRLRDSLLLASYLSIVRPLIFGGYKHMATVIRLTRGGRKKRPNYSVVVMDSRKRRDGVFIEKLGYFDPCKDPEVIQLDLERVKAWTDQGAQVSDRVASLIAKASA